MDYLSFIANSIHTVVAATADNNGLPVTCAIDIMDADENGLYFLTAKGKEFYSRLKNRGYISLTGIKGADTLSRVAVSVRGKAKEIGNGPLKSLFEKNPYMNEIYPTENSQIALTVFKIYNGKGEYFDLSKKPIERFLFEFGNDKIRSTGYNMCYTITAACTDCRVCEAVCPQNCIDFTLTPATIHKEHCLHCGNCMEVCPHRAVVLEEYR